MPSMAPRISIVTLGVTDLHRSRQFYSDGLGWNVASADENIAFFQLGTIVLGLYPRDKLAEDACVEDDGPHRFSGVTLAYNCSSDSEVDDVLSFAESAGATIMKPAQKVFWGGYSGYFADPDGHLWEVAHNPFSTIDENGVLHIGGDADASDNDSGEA